MYLSRSESLKAVLFIRFLKESHRQQLAAVTLTSQVLKGRGIINMHKDISGVLTVSTCLLNHDRNSESDFTETTPPSQSHMCPSLLNVTSLPATVPLTTHFGKKGTRFQRCQRAMVKAQGQCCSLVGASANLPASLSASSFALWRYRLNVFCK